MSGKETARITERQSTFLRVIASGRHFKVSFRNKQEVHWPQQDCVGTTFHSSHPLLLDYTEPHQALYFNAVPADPPLLVSELEQAIRTLFGSYRSLKRYVNGYYTTNKGTRYLEHLFAFPSGLLLRGPLSLVSVSQEILESHRMQSAILPARPRLLEKANVLFLGENYIIAESFVFHEESVSSLPRS